MKSFKAKLMPIKGGGFYVCVTDALAADARLVTRDRVRGTVEGVPYRSSLARYSGTFHVGVQNAILREAGVTGGDTVEMTIEKDPEPPPGELVPADLAAALAKSAQARAGFAAMGPAHRREHVKHVDEAVKHETRQRRIAATIATLEAHAKTKKKAAKKKR